MTWPQQITRYECPVGECKWAHDDDGTGYAGDAGTWTTPGDAVTAILAARLAAVESVLREHLETHTVLDWVREIMRLREAAWQAERDAGLVPAILLRRLGGTAEVHDAELAAEQGTLHREPTATGFRLTVTG